MEAYPIVIILVIVLSLNNTIAIHMTAENIKNRISVIP